MIVFTHIKFGLVRIQGSEVKRGGRNPPPRSEQIFEIPVWVGLSISRNIYINGISRSRAFKVIYNMSIF